MEEGGAEGSSTDFAAVSVLIAESEPARLRELVEKAFDARLLVTPARTLDVAVRVLEREDVDLVLVADDFDHGRAMRVATAGRGSPCVLVTGAERPLPPAWISLFTRVLVRPVTREKLQELLAWWRSL